MTIYGLTDKGVVRDANEDSIGISCLPNGMTIALVCDGMGGAAGGRIASELAEETFMNSMLEASAELERSNFDGKKVRLAILDATARANAAVLERSREDLSLFGMGCTLNAAVFIRSRSRLFFVNVGDSRLYMISKREIKQLTKDHSYVQLLLDNKEITQKEAETHPQKNLITKALGIKEELEPDLYERRISPRAETYFLLCTDGLHGLLPREVLRRVALSERSIHEKVFTYIKLANDAGGYDNISAILMCTKDGEVSG